MVQSDSSNLEKIYVEASLSEDHMPKECLVCISHMLTSSSAEALPKNNEYLVYWNT